MPPSVEPTPQIDWPARFAAASESVDWPTDHPRPVSPTQQRSTASIHLPTEVVESLTIVFGDDAPQTFFLAAWATIVRRYTGAEQFLIEFGPADAPVLLPCDASGTPTFAELATRLREAWAAGERDRAIVAELSADHAAQIGFAFGTHQTQCDLVLRIDRKSSFDSESDIDGKRDTGWWLTVDYRRELFEAATIERLLVNLRTLLEAVADPAAQPSIAVPITILPVIGDEERQRLLDTFNDTAADYPSGCVHELFEAQAARTPGAVAAVFGDESITYAQLDRRANRLAGRLVELGVRPDALVAVCVERSLGMLVAVLGVMKSGGAYVPLDPDYPADRVAYMLTDSAARVLVSESHLLVDLGGDGVDNGGIDIDAPQRIDLDTDWDATRPASADEKPATAVSGEHLAYVIYTSGSTGRPKGVEVPHRAVVNFLTSMSREPGCTADDVLVAVTTLSFDIAVLELYLPLSVGGRVVIASRDEAHDGGRLARLLARHNATGLQATPATWRLLLDAGWEGGRGGERGLKSLCGGEAMPPELARELVPRVRELWNMYGPTETTVWSTVCRIDDGDGPISIGHPIDNTQIRMLDVNRQLVPIGVPGELCIGGDGVVRGYHDRPELTADRFIPDPFAGSDAKPAAHAPRLYRTGDLARYCDDGTIEFLGRLDNQVKIRGFRIELGEVESVLADDPRVASNVVVARADGRGGHFLAAYYTVEGSGDGESSGGAAPPISELRDVLRKRLPDYMVPAAFVVLDRLPLTPNGKVDRKELPEPDIDAYATSNAFRAAGTPLEQFLIEQWQEELGLPRVGVDDNFFELGGDSIRGASLINRVQTRLNEFMYVVALFDHPTVAQFATYLGEKYADAVARHFSGEGASDTASAGGTSASDTPTIDEQTIRQIRALIPARTPSEVRADNEPNPPAVFILSTPRSGTTLLRVMLAGNPRLFAPPELELLGFDTLAERSEKLAGRYALWAEGTMRALMELRHCDAEEARRLMSDAEQRGLTTAEFYAELQAMLGHRLIVDKSTTYALDIDTLRAAEHIFDGARYIHLTRHPAGMIRSFEKVHLDQVFFRHEHPFTARQLAELIWNVCHENILSFLESVPPERQCRLKYEELVADPEAAMRTVCRITDIDYDEAMIEPYTDKETKMTDGIHDISTMLGDMKFHRHGRIDPSLAESWKTSAGAGALSGVTRRMAVRLGYEMPTEEMYRAVSASTVTTTPAKVAALPTDLTCVVGIQPGGSLAPVFCVTGGGGGVFVFEPLARRLGEDRPFYGLQLPGVDGREMPMDDIPTLAARLVAEVRRVRPQGPYVLGGLCAGGSISFEMAQQLRLAGETIELLVLMDTWCPVVRGTLARRAMRWSLWRRAGLHVEALRQRGAKAQLDYARGMWTKFRERGYRLRRRRKNDGRSADEVAWQSQLKQANRQAQASYEPRPYPGKIVHFIQSAAPILSPRDGRARWDDVAEQPVDLHIVPGSHVGILSEENVTEMATLLRRYLAGHDNHTSEDVNRAS